MLNLPPSAASLTTSLRDLGYSLETAVADLIDNCISADATDVKIIFDMSGTSPVFVIIDNGRGMNEDQLIEAMRHGTTDPRKIRTRNDLGRFGLGLKTASFSQCRWLTVVTSVNGIRAAAEWNLENVERDNAWNVAVLDSEEISSQPYINELPNSGTLVIWRDLDRLFEHETGDKREKIVYEKISNVTRHLALVFHRFLAGEVRGRETLSICINYHPVRAFDPFCRSNKATQILREEKIWIGDETVVMQPYILPHHSRLSASEYSFYQDRSDFITNQGVYVYRNCRLMAWGDWFRVVPKTEATKLARVQIDFPSSLDEAWTIDIKKSRALPPHVVRERLRQIIAKIADLSVTVHRGRGQKLFQENRDSLWERYVEHNGIRYAINHHHQLISILLNRLSEQDLALARVMLDSIAASLPVEMIYSDFATHPREVRPSTRDEHQVMEYLSVLRRALYGDENGKMEEFRHIVGSICLLDGQSHLIEEFISENFK